MQRFAGAVGVAAGVVVAADMRPSEMIVAVVVVVVVGIQNRLFVVRRKRLLLRNLRQSLGKKLEQLLVHIEPAELV